MAHAAALSDSRLPAAHDWARAQSVAEATLRRAQAGVVFRRTWPCDDAFARLQELEADPRRSGLLDSTRDLRDGLSVVEVFTAWPDNAAVLASMEFTLV
jgi:hypothetical protein